MTAPAEPLPAEIGIESDVVAVFGEAGVVRARLRIDLEAAQAPVSDGDWLRVRVAVWFFDPEDTKHGRFDAPVAAGPEVDAMARPKLWTVLDLELPKVVAPGAYLVAAKVLSADDRYRRPFAPSKCRIYAVSFAPR